MMLCQTAMALIAVILLQKIVITYQYQNFISGSVVRSHFAGRNMMLNYNYVSSLIHAADPSATALRSTTSIMALNQVFQYDHKRIRNFAIIAHIDAGKSTIADRLLEYTNTVSKRAMRAQLLDTLEVERARGITIKLQTVRMTYRSRRDGQVYLLNLIDCPGHADFGNEVSRSLAVCDGAVLVVDATQGIEAQTLANVQLARSYKVEILPVANKIDLSTANADAVLASVEEFMNIDASSAVKCSAKTGEGIEDLLEAICHALPAPRTRMVSSAGTTGIKSDDSSSSGINNNNNNKCSSSIEKEGDGESGTQGGSSSIMRAHIFDTYYDSYQGLVLLFKVISGVIKKGDHICIVGPQYGRDSYFSSGEGKGDIDIALRKGGFEISELGVMAPHQVAVDVLQSGEVGYLTAGIKSIASSSIVGQSLIHFKKENSVQPHTSQKSVRTVTGSDTTSTSTMRSQAVTVTGSDTTSTSTMRSQVTQSEQRDTTSHNNNDTNMSTINLQCGAGTDGDGDSSTSTAIKHMVFAGMYPCDADGYQPMRDALTKLRLTDGAFDFIQDKSPTMGVGFRCGFLGMLHMEVVQERLEKEYGIELVITSPSVAYKVILKNAEKTECIVDNPSKLPEAFKIESIAEPYVLLEIMAPSKFVGALMELNTNHRGSFLDMKYITPEKVYLSYEIPLSEVITNYHDQLKSCSNGLATMSFSDIGYRVGDLVRLDVAINEQVVPSMASIVPRSQSRAAGLRICEKLKDIIPREQFQVRIQALVNNKSIASAQISALRKDVLAKLYGGDVSRKKKLLDKQKTGKRRMKSVGRVSVPQEAFMAVSNVCFGSK